MFLLYFILGIIFIEILPLFESLITLVATIIEAEKGKWSLKIAQYNDNIVKIEEANTERTPAIGFVYSGEEYYEDEEEDI